MKLPLVLEDFEYKRRDRDGKLSDGTITACRAKVPGGWIVRPHAYVDSPWVFVPDPEHTWEV